MSETQKLTFAQRAILNRIAQKQQGKGVVGYNESYGQYSESGVPEYNESHGDYCELAVIPYGPSDIQRKFFCKQENR